MKAYIYAIIGASLFLVFLKFWAIPTINRAQNYYTAHDRTAFCLLRESMAKENNR